MKNIRGVLFGLMIASIFAMGRFLEASESCYFLSLLFQHINFPGVEPLNAECQALLVTFPEPNVLQHATTVSFGTATSLVQMTKFLSRIRLQQS